MQWVYEAITKYTGVTDQAEIVEIYGQMSDNVRAFNSLSPAELRREAREAKAVNDYLKSEDGINEWERLHKEFRA